MSLTGGTAARLKRWMPKQKKAPLRHYWYVPEEHLWDMLVKWREARAWVEELQRCGVEISGWEPYSPVDLIGDMLGVPPESETYCRDWLLDLMYDFSGITLDEMRELFAHILMAAHHAE